MNAKSVLNKGKTLHLQNICEQAAHSNKGYDRNLDNFFARKARFISDMYLLIYVLCRRSSCRPVQSPYRELPA